MITTRNYPKENKQNIKCIPNNKYVTSSILIKRIYGKFARSCITNLKKKQVATTGTNGRCLQISCNR